MRLWMLTVGGLCLLVTGCGGSSSAQGQLDHATTARAASMPSPTPAGANASRASAAVPPAGVAVPREVLTPGEVFPGATVDQVCTPGYSASVRDVSVDEKRAVYQSYGLSYPQAPGSYEADHDIPIELGGDNSMRNLWPEPADPRPGFHEKDLLENGLHKLVCGRQLSLADAQREIASNWYVVYEDVCVRQARCGG